jgi:hypothetical protein
LTAERRSRSFQSGKPLNIQPKTCYFTRDSDNTARQTAGPRHNPVLPAQYQPIRITILNLCLTRFYSLSRDLDN